jgi:hypothetical protein
LSGSSPYYNDKNLKSNGGSGFEMTPEGYGDVGPLVVIPGQENAAAQYDSSVLNAKVVNRGGGEQ